MPDKIVVRGLWDETSVCSPSGDGTTFDFIEDKDGNLIPQDRINVQAIIESHKEECDIGYMLARFMNGDQSALSQRVGQYLDTTVLPQDLLDAYQMGAAGQEAFESLTDEQKEFVSKGDFESLSKSMAKSPETETVELLARLKALTGKEVHIDE